MRFVIYKNSILASFCSIFGTGFAAMGVFMLIDDFSIDNLLIAVPVIAIGLGMMWLGSFISAKKAERKRKKTRQTAAANASASAAGYAPPQPAPRYTASEPPKQPEPAPKANGQNIQEQIQACKDLLECGLLTQAEYEQKIRELTREYNGG